MHLRPEPKPTNGHHFGALLHCPRKAWFNYHAHEEMKAPLPLSLRAMQREGLAYEREVIERIYPDAYVVSGKRVGERIEATRKAMRRGEPVILQAQFHDGHRTGVADLLERTDAAPGYRLGHVYRVGDIKSAATVSLGNLYQVGWYSRMLADEQEHTPTHAFLIMGDGRREEIELSLIDGLLDQAYVDLLQLRLLSARQLDEAHPPVLTRHCLSCAYRYTCMPLLQRGTDLTLLPGLGRNRLQRLRDAGLTRWDELDARPDADLAALGF
ncbi:MAG: hypothetical protein WBA12_14385, partial [Catalinimonas sp.]